MDHTSTNWNLLRHVYEGWVELRNGRLHNLRLPDRHFEALVLAARTKKLGQQERQDNSLRNAIGNWLYSQKFGAWRNPNRTKPYQKNNKELWQKFVDESRDYPLVLTARDLTPATYVDQFNLANLLEVPVKTVSVCGAVFSRSAVVRQKVLDRAKGSCEFCGLQGFRLDDGRLFLETHHIVPLSEEGKDSEENVIGLCPTHHREAHLGMHRNEMRVTMKKIVAGKRKQGTGQ
jgi:5-methylcytosine-specific restriction endonuclease McrA